MRISFLTYAGLESLKARLAIDAPLYGKDSPDALLKTVSKKALVDTGIECKNLNLIISNNPDDDYENVRRVYSVLKDVLSESNASDERVWAALFFKNECWKYVNARWKKGGWKVTTIKDRIFFGQHPKTRNALCRLYWIGKMTYDSGNKEDPWHYTRFVCSNQRYIEDMLGRNTANNLKLIKACADACNKYNEEYPQTKIDSNRMRDLQKYMNILGATYIIDSIEYDVLVGKLYTKALSLSDSNS